MFTIIAPQTVQRFATDRLEDITQYPAEIGFCRQVDMNSQLLHTARKAFKFITGLSIVLGSGNALLDDQPLTAVALAFASVAGYRYATRHFDNTIAANNLVIHTAREHGISTTRALLRATSANKPPSQLGGS